MKILKRVAILRPSGNVTALLFDGFDNDRKSLNSAVIRACKKINTTFDVEQCGFIRRSSESNAIIRLEMLGGEFCGNATRCAVLLANNQKTGKGYVQVSGVKRLLKWEIKHNKNVVLEMPIDLNKNVRRVAGGYLVSFEGITHFVIFDSNEEPQEILKKCKEKIFDLNNEVAFGVSIFNNSTNKARYCVYVKKVNTIFKETACASGTAAIGLALCLKSKKKYRHVAVEQPSGKALYVTVMKGYKKQVSVSLDGTISVLYEGPLIL